MSKISNTITMLNLLSTGKKYNIDELANILEVSPRMIRTYKEELEKTGIYIDTIMGPYGGYVLNKFINIPARGFKKEDYEILDKYIENTSCKDEKEKLEILREKIKSVYLSSNTNTKLNLNDKYNILVRAIKERRKVKILYYSFDKGDNERIIQPAEMFLYKDGWYCAAFCELRKDIRHFELERIKNLIILDEKF